MKAPFSSIHGFLAARAAAVLTLTGVALCVSSPVLRAQEPKDAPAAKPPVVSPAPAAAPRGDDEKWRKELAADLVKTADGKMTIVRYDLVTIRGEEEGSDRRKTVRVRSEAPESGVLSRDNFVAYTEKVYMGFLQGLADGEDFTTETMEPPKGDVDVEINVTMNRDGFQVEGVDKKTGEKSPVTQKWSELFNTKK